MKVEESCFDQSAFITYWLFNALICVDAPIPKLGEPRGADAPVTALGVDTLVLADPT